MQNIIFRMVRGWLLKKLIAESLDVLKKEAMRTESKYDDQTVDWLKQRITKYINSL